MKIDMVTLTTALTSLRHRELELRKTWIEAIGTSTELHSVRSEYDNVARARIKLQMALESESIEIEVTE